MEMPSGISGGVCNKEFCWCDGLSYLAIMASIARLNVSFPDNLEGCKLMEGLLLPWAPPFPCSASSSCSSSSAAMSRKVMGLILWCFDFWVALPLQCRTACQEELDWVDDWSMGATKLTPCVRIASLTRAEGNYTSLLWGSDAVNITLISGFHFSWTYCGPNSLILESNAMYPILSWAQSITSCHADGSLINELARFRE